MKVNSFAAGPVAPDAESVAAILGDHFEIDAVWSRHGTVVIRGRPYHLDERRFGPLAECFDARGWRLRWERAGPDWLLLIERSRRTPWLAAGLFLATVVAVVFLRPFTLTGFGMEGFWGVFWAELPFAYALFPILLAHEFGHYFAARAHDYPASLPYFIPGFYPFGTFGAVIVARFPFRDRRVLFDVAVAGPIAGFLVSIPVLGYGLAHSSWIAVPSEGGLLLGDPLLMKWLAGWVLPPAPGPDMDILLHPAAFGGWAGLFVTMLNLLPFGPLDGGKTAYALFGARQRWLGWTVWLALAATLFYTYFWMLWLGLALMFRIAHPPTLNDEVAVGAGRRLVGLAVLAVFLLSFMPFPFRL